jgi:hypothetical protein
MKHRAQAALPRINVAERAPTYQIYVACSRESALTQTTTSEILLKSTLTFGFNDRLDARDGEYGDDNVHCIPSWNFFGARRTT